MMNCKSIGIIFLISSFLSSAGFGTQIWKEENCSVNVSQKVNSDSLWIEIISLQTQIAQAHQEANFKQILRSHTKFRTLKFSEDQWQDIAQHLKVYKWCSQNWHQSVAGHLFYPKEVNALLEAPYTQRLLMRSDRIWAFAVAAYYHHPLGQYYLAHIIDKIRSNYSDADQPEFFDKLYKTSIKTLCQHLDHNDACYVLGTAKLKYPYIGNLFKKDLFSQKKATFFFKKGTDFRNQLQALIFQNKVSKSEGYLRLAQQGYAPAYTELASESEDFAEKKNFLTQAINLGDHSALIDLGNLYKQEENYPLAQNCYKEAAEKGITKGHIQYGISLVGDVISGMSEFMKDLDNLSPEIIQEAAHHFMLAGQAKDPQGWEYLAALKMDLFKRYKTEKLIRAVYEALVEGIKLGSDEAYHKTYLYFPEDEHPGTFTSLIKAYGYPPQERLYKQIASYWESLK